MKRVLFGIATLVMLLVIAPSQMVHAQDMEWPDLKSEIESGGTASIDLPASLTSDETVTVPGGADITLVAEGGYGNYKG